ncbi:MAG: hypothetical protein CMB80_32255 [Flammeovirgaceae bacterium]|nr:hypothetical protein [Flammeovirgaceae bacterium]MBR07432.1 hypothetical protein [Rickettsiales bacterium]|tara:strand:- start:1336 stop:2607 length:1272 start_codon:yes stop_codon:yes gene_type:complete
MEVIDIAKAIRDLFGFEIIAENDEVVSFTIISDKTASLNKKETAAIIKNLSKYKSNEDVELYNSKSYEVLIRNETLYFFNTEIIKEDPVNKLKYSIDKPSDEYLIFLLSKLHQTSAPSFLRGGIIGHRLRRVYSQTEISQTELFDRSILSILKEVVPRIETIQISSKTNLELNQFENLLYAFIFNLGYNTDFSVMPLRFLDEFVQTFRINRIRKSRTSDIEAPKRIYSNELILHYQKGISSESIDHQFLSFYHVLEHFYEKIYNDDIISRVKSEITKPNFSYKRTKDLNNLIGIIQSRLRYKNEEFQINELEAVELVLRRFIPDLNELNQALDQINPNLAEYYRIQSVPFSNGNKVNFSSNSEDEIYRNLAKRVYLTRNCIVHSKESQKVKFTPFKDDKDLLNEIYLMRLLAEFVILNDSKEL